MQHNHYFDIYQRIVEFCYTREGTFLISLVMIVGTISGILASSLLVGSLLYNYKDYL